MGLIILPPKEDRKPEHGAGLDRDGPPRDLTVERYCEGRHHPKDKSRRFDAPPGYPPIPLCPPCRRQNQTWHDQVKAGLMSESESPLHRTHANRGGKGVDRLIVVPNRTL